MSENPHGEARSTGRQILVALLPLGIAVVGLVVFAMVIAAQDPAAELERSIVRGALSVVVMAVIAFFATIIRIARILSRHGRPPEPHILPEGLSDNPTPPPPLPGPPASAS